MNHEPFEDLVAGQALGALSADDQKTLNEHLATGCPRCRELERLFANAADALALSTEAQMPQPNLKRRLIADLGLNSARSSVLPAWWMRGVVALAACALIAILIPPMLRQPQIGHVLVADGSVLINGKPAKANMPIREGQRITTAADSTAEIWAADRVLIKIKPRTDAALTQVNAGYQLNLRQGGAISLVKTGTPYAVATSVLKAEALGTGFFVQTEAPDRVYVCICSGHIQVSKGDFRQDLQATHHKAMVATQLSSGIQTAEGTLINHDDDEIGALVAHFK